MTLNIDAKFEEKLTLGSEDDMRSPGALKNLKICTLRDFFVQDI